jgi:hypothetical protein
MIPERQCFVTLGVGMRLYIRWIATLLFIEIGMLFTGIAVYAILYEILVLIFQLIVVIVFYIRVVSNLGKCAKITNNRLLTRSYYSFCGSIIFNIIYLGLSSACNLGLFPQYLTNFFSLFESGDNIFSYWYVLSIPSYICQVIAVIALFRWIQSYVHDNFTNPMIAQLPENAKLLIWGIMLTIIPLVGEIMEIMVIVGWNRLGNALIYEFSNEYSKNTKFPSEQVVSDKPIDVPDIPPVLNKEFQQFCPNCGENLDYTRGIPRFCPKCGRRL